MSAAKKTKKDLQHTSVLFTGAVKLLNSAFHISKTTKPISTKFIYFLPYSTYTLLHTSKLKEIALALLEIFVPKICPIFFTFFFSFAQNYKYITLSRIKIPFPCFDFFQIWNTYNAQWHLHFLKILRNPTVYAHGLPQDNAHHTIPSIMCMLTICMCNLP